MPRSIRHSAALLPLIAASAALAAASPRAAGRAAEGAEAHEAPAPPPTVVGGDALDDAPPARDGATVLGAEPSPAATDASGAGVGALDAPPLPSVAPSEERRREALATLRDRLYPRPLELAELDWWAAQSGLAIDSIALLRDLHAQYRAAIPPIDPANRDAVVAGAFDWRDGDRRLDARITPVYLSMLGLRNQARSGLKLAEERLIADFLRLVPPERLPFAQRLVFQRRWALEAQPTVARSALVDLVSLAEEIEVPESHAPLVAEALDEYVRLVGATLAWRAEQLVTLENDEATLRVQLGPAWEFVVDPLERRDIEAELRELAQGRERVDAPLRDLTRDALARLVRVLPPPAADALQERFWQQVHPDLFHDEHALADLVRAAAGEDGLAPGDRNARLAFLAATRLRLMPLGFDAAAIADRRDAALVSTASGLGGDGWSAVERLQLEARLLDVFARRREICLGAARTMEGMLAAGEGAVLDRLRAYRRELEVRGEADGWMARAMRSRVAEIEAFEQAAAQRAREEEKDRLALLDAVEASQSPPPVQSDAAGQPQGGDAGSAPPPPPPPAAGQAAPTGPQYIPGTRIRRTDPRIFFPRNRRPTLP